jgi:small nuclear ribonucleoprotein (snRNP)-like protein
MPKQKVTSEVQINFKEGKRTIEMLMKDHYEIENCEKGKIVMLNLIIGETYTGIFKGIDDEEEIILGSISSENTIGIKLEWLKSYFEQVSS